PKVVTTVPDDLGEAHEKTGVLGFLASSFTVDSSSSVWARSDAIMAELDCFEASLLCAIDSPQFQQNAYLVSTTEPQCLQGTPSIFAVGSAGLGMKVGAVD